MQLTILSDVKNLLFWKLIYLALEVRLLLLQGETALDMYIDINQKLAAG